MTKNKDTKSSIWELFGLSFFERPILDHDAKAHVTDFITDFMKSGGFHEIWRISYRFHTDFTLKSSGFHPEIWQISWNPWNPADFTQISPVKSTQNYKSCFSKNSSVWWMQGGGYDQGFHEIHQISPWNLVDFTHENLADFTCEIHPNYKSKCFSKNSLVWWMQGGGFHPRNLVDFTLKSGGFQPWNLVDFTRFPLWNPP